MITNLRIELDDDQLRSVRAALGRGGKATRKDVSAWALRLLFDAVKGAPAPVRRQSKPVQAKAQLENRARDWDAATEAADDAVCGHCGFTKERHGKMAFSCPPPHHTRFRGIT